MTAATLDSGRGSAYPTAVAELLPRARELATELGRAPSRNLLMRELRIGAEKAKALLDELTAEPAEPAEPAGQPAATVTVLPRPPRAVPPAGPDTPATAPGPAAAPVAPVPAETVRPVESLPAAPAAEVAGGSAGPVGGRVRSWPVLLLALPAFVAIWSGWVGLGGLTGFGVVHPLPGIWDGFAINSAITLPVGMETYAAFALRVWLSPAVPPRARRFARWSAVASLGLGAAGQVAYHLMTAAGVTAAPPVITTVVACLPVAVLGMGAALAHLLHDTSTNTGTEDR
jgi:hypothetical protein